MILPLNKKWFYEMKTLTVSQLSVYETRSFYGPDFAWLLNQKPDSFPVPLSQHRAALIF